MRFGPAIALLTGVPMYPIYYMVQPTPGVLAAKRIVLDGLLQLLPAVAVAYRYRDQARA